MKSYEEFKTNVLGNIERYLPKEFKECKPEIYEIRKETKTYDGLILNALKGTPEPIVYLEDFFHEYDIKECTMSEIMKEIVETYVNATSSMPDYNLSTISEDNLVIKLISKNQTKEFLDETLHFDFISEFIAIFQIVVFDNGNSLGTIRVSKSIARTKGWKVENIKETAIKNTFEKHPTTLNSMENVLLGDDKACVVLSEEFNSLNLNDKMQTFLILSNDEKMNGSVALISNEVLKKIGDKIGDYYILPSSIHECLIIPKSGMMASVEELQRMVREVNDAQVAIEERLGYEVLFYNEEKEELNVITY